MRQMQETARSLPQTTPAEHAAAAVIMALRDRGHAAYVVGGAVRDRLLQRVPSEVDVGTSARPEQVQAVFPRTYAVGAAFGVVVVLIEDQQIEVATFRQDGGYVDGRRPERVTFSDAATDAERRDFTINALFYDPLSKVIIDFTGGLADLGRGVVRAIGSADKRFAEDRLRMLRAVRFSAGLGFALESETAAAIKSHAAAVSSVAPERVFSELTKMLTGPHADAAFAQLDAVGLLPHILPEVVAMKGVTQPPQFHPEGDVFVHTLLLLKHLCHPTPVIAWSALLHDVGKPRTFAIGEHGRETFPCHAQVGAEMAGEILRRLRCSKRFTEAVTAAVRHHMTFAEVQRMRPATLRRMLGRETFADELELHRIDCMASHGKLTNYVFLLDALHRLANEPAVPAPLLTGHDLLAAGLSAGPRIGELLRTLQELQLDGVVTDREAALSWLQQQLSRH